MASVLYVSISLVLLEKIIQDETETFPSPSFLKNLSYSSRHALTNTVKPRAFGYYFQSAHSSLLATHPPARRLPIHWEETLYELYPTKRKVLWTKRDEMAQIELEHSRHYDTPNRNPLNPYKNHPECVPMHRWQTQSFPTCNLIHETYLGQFLFYNKNDRNQRHQEPLGRDHELVRLKAHGYFRDVYEIKDYDKISKIAFKTNRFERTFDAWTLDRHRMDALAMDRMTQSMYIMDIYGYCGVGSLVEFATSDLMHVLYKEQAGDNDALEMKEGGNINKSENKFLRRLRYGLDVANAITDLHTIDSIDGIHSAIVHADIFTSQVVKSEVGSWKLNDFNRCTFLYWNTTSDNETCPYLYTDYNAGLFRSPEEYAYTLQSEKIDVFALGNILYVLLTDKEPFEDMMEEHNSTVVKELVQNGTKPYLERSLYESADPSVKALIKAMEMCQELDWRTRARAIEVRDYLDGRLRDILFQEEKKIPNTEDTEQLPLVVVKEKGS